MAPSRVEPSLTVAAGQTMVSVELGVGLDDCLGADDAAGGIDLG